MKIANPIILIQEYIAEPEGTLKKAELRDIINSHSEYVKMLKDQTFVKNTLSGINSPDAPKTLSLSIKARLDNLAQANINNTGYGFERLPIKLFIIGAVTVGAVSTLIFVHSLLQRNKAYNTDYSYTEISKPAYTNIEKFSLFTKHNYWSAGYKGITDGEIFGLDLMPEAQYRFNKRSVIGYKGDITEYYGITNIHRANLSGDILSKTRTRMLSGTSTVDEVSEMLEEASVVTHKVQRVEIE
ncbi:hypothetical protein ACFL4S_00120 [bacterium]